MAGLNAADDQLIKIKTMPPGSRIEVAGVTVGETGEDGLSVPWNQGAILIRKPLYETETLRFTYPPAATEVQVALKRVWWASFPKTGAVILGMISIVVIGLLLFMNNGEGSSVTVRVQTDVPHVEVFADQAPTALGVTDASGGLVMELSKPQPRQLRFEKQGYQKAVRALEPGRVVQALRVHMRPAETKFVMRTDQPSVAIRADGKLVGQTNRRGELTFPLMVKQDNVSITLEKPGYEPITTEVDVRGREVVKLPKIELQRAGLQPKAHDTRSSEQNVVPETPHSPSSLKVRTEAPSQENVKEYPVSSSYDQVLRVARVIDSPGKHFQLSLSAPFLSLGRVMPGQNLEFVVDASRDCYLTILNINSKGELNLLFPNKWTVSNRISGQRTYRIPGSNAPFNFKAAEPGGQHYFKAIATVKPVDFLSSVDLQQRGAFHLLQEPMAALRAIRRNLGNLDAEEWAEDSLTILIE